MKLNEYLKKLHQSPMFRSVLPMNQGALYPMFSVENGKLCSHFLTHKTEITKDGMKVYHPEFYLTFTYPGCTLVKFERLAFDKAFSAENFDTFEVINKPDADELNQRKNELNEVLQLAEKVLGEWDENESADVSEYNSAYFKILTEKQREVFKKL